MDDAIISRYTRAQAIRDELIHPLPENMTREVGFLAPVHLTQKLHAALFDWPGRGERDRAGETAIATDRILRLLLVTFRAARADRERSTLIDFDCDLPTHPAAKLGPDPKRLRIMLHDGDNGEALFTLGFAADEW